MPSLVHRRWSPLVASAMLGLWGCGGSDFTSAGNGATGGTTTRTSTRVIGSGGHTEGGNSDQGGSRSNSDNPTSSAGNSGGVQCDTQSIELEAVADTYIDEDLPEQNFGTEATLYISKSATGTGRRTLVAFDIGAVPTTSTVLSAALVLTGSQPNLRILVNVHRLLETWGETEATWALRSAASPWSTPGGQFVAEPTTATDMQLSTQNAGGDVSNDIALFRSGVASNFGWLLKDSDEMAGTEDGGGSMRRVYFGSRTASVRSTRPKLVISFCQSCGQCP